MITFAIFVVLPLAFFGAICLGVVVLYCIRCDVRRIANALDHQEAADKVVPLWPPRRPAA